MRHHCTILKQSYNGEIVDCTNNGLSSKYDRAILLDNEEYEDYMKNPSKKDIAVFMLRPGKGGRDFIAVPLSEKYEYPMFGGNFLYSSDSRFPSMQPIHIHDRFE